MSSDFTGRHYSGQPALLGGPHCILVSALPEREHVRYNGICRGIMVRYTVRNVSVVLISRHNFGVDRWLCPRSPKQKANKGIPTNKQRIFQYHPSIPSPIPSPPSLPDTHQTNAQNRQNKSTSIREVCKYDLKSKYTQVFIPNQETPLLAFAFGNVRRFCTPQIAVSFAIVHLRGKRCEVTPPEDETEPPAREQATKNSPDTQTYTHNN